MPKTEAQMLEEARKLADAGVSPELQNSITSNLKKEAEDKARQIQQNAALQRELKGKGEEQKKTALSAEKWRTLISEADNLVKSGQNGFDNFISAMSKAWAMYGHLFDAMHASNPVGSAVGWVYDKARSSELKLGKLGKLGDVVKGIEQAFHPVKPEPITLPELHQYVEFGDDNKLNLDSLKKNFLRSDNKPLEEVEVEHFQVGVIAWLMERGYSPDPATPNQYINNDTHNRLTKNEFIRLRDDEDHGLNKYLASAFDMKFKQTPPSPAP